MHQVHTPKPGRLVERAIRLNATPAVDLHGLAAPVEVRDREELAG